MTGKLTESYFLWPKGNIPTALVSMSALTSVSVIEEQFRSMFPTGYPVLCSSGRAALIFALIFSEVSRNDLVGVFPYASHCVLDAISRIATPLSGTDATTASLRVVYHQWGYVQETNLSPNTIEDCADTLCVPATELFPGGGRFEIWSLPKILGTTSGGVLWCRYEETAIKLRDFRNKRGGGTFQWLLRLLAGSYPRLYHYWQGAEGASGEVSRLQTGEIIKAIRKWEDFVFDRQKKLEMVLPFAVKWLPSQSNRLPTVVPIDLKLSDSIIREWGISSGFRMIERLDCDGTRKLVKVLPVPIHQDVPEPWLEKQISRIRSNILL